MLCGIILPTLAVMATFTLSDAYIFNTAKHNLIRRVHKRHATDEGWGDDQQRQNHATVEHENWRDEMDHQAHTTDRHEDWSDEMDHQAHATDRHEDWSDEMDHQAHATDGHEDWSDEMLQQQSQEMCFTIPHLQVLKSQFSGYIDKNGDEKASREEILDYLQKYNPKAAQEQLDNFIARRDMDGDGSVDFIPDYLMEVSAPDYDEKTAREWFELEDTNGDKHVSARELMTIAMKVGMSQEEAQQTVLGYYMAADRNGDGRLSWEEYRPLFLA